MIIPKYNKIINGGLGGGGQGAVATGVGTGVSIGVATGVGTGVCIGVATGVVPDVTIGVATGVTREHKRCHRREHAWPKGWPQAWLVSIGVATGVATGVTREHRSGHRGGHRREHRRGHRVGVPRSNKISTTVVRNACHAACEGEGGEGRAGGRGAPPLPFLPTAARVLLKQCFNYPGFQTSSRVSLSDLGRTDMKTRLFIWRNFRTSRRKQTGTCHECSTALRLGSAVQVVLRSNRPLTKVKEQSREGYQPSSQGLFAGAKRPWERGWRGARWLLQLGAIQ